MTGRKIFFSTKFLSLATIPAMITKYIFLIPLLLSCSVTVSQTRPQADLIIHNAKIWTVDPRQPSAEAVAVVNDRIVAVGANADIDTWRGTRTKILDAEGHSVLPGFNDAHVHFIQGGLSLINVDMKDARSPEEFKQRVAQQLARTQPGEWVLGGLWDETKWPNSKLPSATLIDAITGSTPTFLSRYDGHMGLANSAAMKIAGITEATKDVPGGVILRDARGHPTGIFKDAAQKLVERFIPPLTHTQRMRVAQLALEHANSVGVTSVQDMMVEYDSIGVYSELAERGALTVRFYVAPKELGSAGASWEDFSKIGLRRATGSSYLRFGAIKGFADGSIGSATAYMFEPFSNDPGNTGILSEEMHSGMGERLIKADAAGLQPCIHAIGDRAVSMTLDIFESVLKANGDHDQRFRIEHAQHLAPADFERLAKLKVIASMQPYHAIDDGRWVEKRIGPERAKRAYAWRSVLDRGVKLAFGTDWEVAPLNPMLGLYAAITRATLDGKNPQGWVPEQKITLAEAIEAYTIGSAYAEFQEKEKGSITPGKLADMVILDKDLFAVPPEQIPQVRVMKTIVGAKIVFTRND